MRPLNPKIKKYGKMKDGTKCRFCKHLSSELLLEGLAVCMVDGDSQDVKTNWSACNRYVKRCDTVKRIITCPECHTPREISLHAQISFDGDGGLCWECSMRISREREKTKYYSDHPIDYCPFGYIGIGRKWEGRCKHHVECNLDHANEQYLRCMETTISNNWPGFRGLKRLREGTE